MVDDKELFGLGSAIWRFCPAIIASWINLARLWLASSGDSAAAPWKNGIHETRRGAGATWCSA